MSSNFVRLMIDSGAFSVWRMGESISLNQYIAWLQINQDLLSSWINLDIIPGKPGVAKTSAQVEEAAQSSFKNAVRMRAEGVEPMVVYHMGERAYWLEKMVGEGFSYIGLGGMAVAGDKARTPWIRECFTKLCGSSLYPGVKVHGLGVTSVDVMSAFPWASVDSISWFKQGASGSVYIPRSMEGIYNYNVPPITLAISSPGRKGPSGAALAHGRHLSSCGESTKRYILQYLETEGFDPQTLADDYEERVRLNARFFRRYAKNHIIKPFVSCGTGLMNKVGKGLCPEDLPISKFKLVFGCGTYLDYASILRREGCRNQLISFHRIQTGPKFNLKNYVQTGWFVRDSMIGKKRPWEGGRCGVMKPVVKFKGGLHG